MVLEPDHVLGTSIGILLRQSRHKSVRKAAQYKATHLAEESLHRSGLQGISGEA